MIKNNFFKLLIDFLLLPQNDISFPLNSRVLEFGVLEDVADDVNSGTNVLFKTLGIVHGLFARRIRVEMSTEIFDLDFESVLISAVCTFESHVLEEVSRSVICLCLCARACVYPDADSGGLRMAM